MPTWRTIRNGGEEVDGGLQGFFFINYEITNGILLLCSISTRVEIGRRCN